jgi:hypothetical protein
MPFFKFVPEMEYVHMTTANDFYASQKLIILAKNSTFWGHCTRVTFNFNNWSMS